jgi:hypothetical protein
LALILPFQDRRQSLSLACSSFTELGRSYEKILTAGFSGRRLQYVC